MANDTSYRGFTIRQQAGQFWVRELGEQRETLASAKRAVDVELARQGGRLDRVAVRDVVRD